MSNQIFNYNGSDITMNKENGKIYVNATEMAKPFNKRTSDWLSTKQANELISSLSIVTGIPVTVLVSVNQGGTGQGTWMQEDVALLFAQWLSPQFYILCNSKIKELLKQGYTTLDGVNRKELAKMILEQEEEKEKLQLRIEHQSRELKSQAPKVLFADAIVASENSILIGKLATVLKQNGVDIGQNRLFKWMREKGYLCKSGERYNQPTQSAMDAGIFEVSYNTIVRSDKSIQTITTKVTGKGQMYFVNKFLGEKELA